MSDVPPRRRFRSLGFMLSWAEDQIGGPATSVNGWPNRAPTRRAIEKVVRTVWLDGRARGRQERDQELLVALGIGAPDPDDSIVPHDPDSDPRRAPAGDRTRDRMPAPSKLDPVTTPLVESSRGALDDDDRTSVTRRRPRRTRGNVA
jgi:hypothetical protein